MRLAPRHLLPCALLALAPACATLTQPSGALPTGTPATLQPGPVACTATTLASASWPTLAALVSAELERQRAAACMPPPLPTAPANPQPPAQPAQAPSSAP